MRQDLPAGLSPQALLAALDYQIALGADEAIGAMPVDRMAAAAARAAARAPERAGMGGDGAPAGAERGAGRAAAEAPDTGPARGGAGFGRREAGAAAAPGRSGPAAAGLPAPGLPGPGPAAGPGLAGPGLARAGLAGQGGEIDPVAEARAAAGAAENLAALEAALAGFEHCELKPGARSLVFADGTPGARLMIIGEAPGRDEDIQGKPFVGRAGQLLDRMLAAIGLDRRASEPDRAVYITNILPWRPPQNREPTPEEIAMLRPFVERHVALAAPRLLVAMGNTSCQALLGRRGITRLRGQWAEAFGLPVLPMFHPAYLLRNPAAKREAWADLLALQARLRRAAGAGAGRGEGAGEGAGR